MSPARQNSVIWVDPEHSIQVIPPVEHPAEAGRAAVSVPWVIHVDGMSLSLHIADTATLTRLRDVITAALDEQAQR